MPIKQKEVKTCKRVHFTFIVSLWSCYFSYLNCREKGPEKSLMVLFLLFMVCCFSVETTSWLTPDPNRDNEKCFFFLPSISKYLIPFSQYKWGRNNNSMRCKWKEGLSLSTKYTTTAMTTLVPLIA